MITLVKYQSLHPPLFFGTFYTFLLSKTYSNLNFLHDLKCEKMKFYSKFINFHSSTVPVCLNMSLKRENDE